MAFIAKQFPSIPPPTPPDPLPFGNRTWLNSPIPKSRRQRRQRKPWNKKPQIPNVIVVPPPPPSPGVLTFADFTHLGTILLPASEGDDQTYYGQGLAAYRQPADGNQIHLVYGSFRPSFDSWPIYECRYITPENPADPTNISLYTRPPIMARYNSAPYIGQDSQWRRVTRLNGVEVIANASSGPDFMGFGFGHDGKLYITWAMTYSDGSDPDTYNFLRATLNYASPSASYAEGPWGIDIHGNKATGKSAMIIPEAYANAYLGGKRLALAGPGYGSIAGTGDVSMGLSITAIGLPVVAAERANVAGTDVMGYWPWTGTPGAGRDRSNRPAPLDNFLEPAWPNNKWTWDQIEGGSVWIDNGTKRGVIFFTTQSMEAIDYHFSAPYSLAAEMYWGFYDPQHFKPVTGGNRYDAQPVSWQKVTYPAMMKSFSSTLLGSITQVTSTAGVGKNVTGTNSAHVHWTNHGRVVGDWVVIRNNSRSEYNGFWAVTNVISANEFTVWTPNDSSTWSGIAGTGGTAHTSVNFGKPVHRGSAVLEDLLFVRWAREGFSAGQHVGFVEVYRFGTTTPTTGNTYYVSPSGNDANPGTLASPKKTIRAGVALLTPGDTLFIRGGTYTTADDVIDSVLYTVPSGNSWVQPVTISGFPGETVIIRPPNGTHAHRIANNDKYIIFQDLRFDYVNDNTDREGLYVSGGAHHIRHRRVRVTNCSNLGVVFAQGCAGFCEFLDGEVDLCGRNDTDLTRGHAFYISCGDNIFDGNNIHDNAGYGYHLYDDAGPFTTSRNLIRRNRIYRNGLNHTTAYGIVTAWGSDNLIYSNLVYGNKQGILVYTNSFNAKVFNNTVVGNIGEGITLQFYGSAPQVRNNIVWNNGGTIVNYGGTGTPNTTPNLTSVDPMFVSSTDFHLTQFSPARDTGATIPEVELDFDSIPRPRGDFFDQGAYEY